MGLQDFMDATFGDIQCILHGYGARQRDRSREAWEQARMISFWSVYGHLKKDSAKTYNSLIPFEWDKVEKESHVFNEEQRKAFLKMAKINMQVKKEKKLRDELIKQNKKNAKPR